MHVVYGESRLVAKDMPFSRDWQQNILERNFRRVLRLKCMSSFTLVFQCYVHMSLSTPAYKCKGCRAVLRGKGTLVENPCMIFCLNNSAGWNDGWTTYICSHPSCSPPNCRMMAVISSITPQKRRKTAHFPTMPPEWTKSIRLRPSTAPSSSFLDVSGGKTLSRNCTCTFYSFNMQCFAKHKQRQTTREHWIIDNFWLLQADSMWPHLTRENCSEKWNGQKPSPWLKVRVISSTSPPKDCYPALYLAALVQRTSHYQTNSLSPGSVRLVMHSVHVFTATTM